MYHEVYQFFLSPLMLLVVKAVVILIIALVASLSVSAIFRKLIARCNKKGEAWRYVILTSLLKPLLCLIALIGICFAINVFLTHVTDTLVLKFIPVVLKCGIVAFMSWVAISFINGAQAQCMHSHTKKGLDKTTIFAITKLARVIVIVFALLFILPIFGIGISGLIAFGSVGGAAVAFASKDLLANFFGGIIVYFDKPFAIGDWIRSPDRDIEGTVEYIGWRSCRVRTFDLRPLYIPNSLFTTISIENASRMTHRQINMTVGVRYDDAKHIKAIVDDIRTMLQTHPDIDTTQALIVNFVNFGSSTLDILVYAFTKTIVRVDFQNSQQDIFLKIIDIISSYGAQCAFPTTTIDFPTMTNIPKAC
jgi:MscS family membrane protein